MRRLAVLLAALLATTLLATPSAQAGTKHVLERRVIGHSVQGRPIVAWHLANYARGKRTGPTVVLMSTMHGNEPATRRILESLRDGAALRGVDLWVLPVYNPDGLAHGHRRNAHGVDLNRNFPYDWAPMGGNYDSGPRPASEPETRAAMRFLTDVDPDYVLSFHQPLHGVDVATERPAFSRKVARTLHLPATSLDCGSSCHGTMTMWFNHHFDGFALTVEYGARPPQALMRTTAPMQVLRIFGATAGQKR
jgi:murein peptide amidase A